MRTGPSPTAAHYARASLPIRDDLASAHQAQFDRWARPGTWWTAAERTAIVAEARRARAAEPLPAWEPPSSVEGLVPDDHPLSTTAVDAIWRLANHPGTLTADRYATTLDGGLTAEQYVELVGLVASASSVDLFARGMGIDLLPFQEPQAGDPSRDRPDEVAVDTHWVPTVKGSGPNVGKALTLVPDVFDAFEELSHAQYVPAEALVGDLTWSRGDLERLQIELVAARTSVLNDCFY
ncbi:MAG: hypothetical protein GY929_24950 [Actinomycetia bacterium]|nr:hypothetical protein [Actinomycetes bacterium]